MERNIYLDNAATTMVAPEVVEAMMPYFSGKYGNPSSIHSYGREAKAAIERARKSIAHMLNAAPGEVFFTSGGTETANMIIYGAINDLGVTRIITSRIEHHCVLHTVASQFRRLRVDYVPLDDKGNIEYEELAQMIHRGEKTLVCLMYANNEIGNVTDITRVGELCKKSGAWFFSDTVQAVTFLPLNLQQTNVHFISGSAHKFHGPKGTGFMYMRGDAMLKPVLHGGSQERNVRSGTENLTGIIGMEKAMSLALSNAKDNNEHIKKLKQHFLETLQDVVPGVSVNGDLKGIPKVLNVSFPSGAQGEYLVQNLDMMGIAASAGSACSSGSSTGSHVIDELHLPEGTTAVRFSFSRYNAMEELDEVVKKIGQLLSGSTG